MTHCRPCQNGDGLPVDSELQCQEIHADSLCVACTDIAIIDMQIAETQDKLRELQIQRQRLLPLGNRSHDILTSNLPVEICTKIFLESLPDIEELDSKSHPRLLTAPLVLSWVCSRWRDIAHGSPNLWAQLALSLQAKSAVDNVLTLVAEWLERGGNTQPLYITLSIDPLIADGHRQSKGEDTNSVDAILNLLAQQSHRFVFFSIAAPAYHMKHLSFQPHRAANLQSLHLIGLTVKGTRESVWLCDPRPRPTSLTLRNLRWNQLLQSSTSHAPDSISTPGILIDLSVLNTLTVALIELEDCIELFKLAPAVKTCTVSWLGEFNSAGAFEYYRIRRLPNIPPPTVYEALEELTFLDLTTEHCQFILNAFDFPSLRRFTSKENNRRYGQTYGTIHSLTNHIRRAGVELISLHLDNLRCHGNVKSLVEDLMTVAGPTLNNLILEHINTMYDNPLRVIQGIFGDLSHLPELRSIRVYSPASEWMHSFRELVTSAHKLAIHNRQPLSVALSTTPDFYSNGSFKDALDRDEVLDMLSTMSGDLVTIRLLQGRMTEGPWRPDQDVTADIMNALNRTVGNQM
ncbi:hypothetical protein D9619_002385 [Psilocybe cf. subviscida]|uniref:F-box domain-containing protein n=1 Tax=Psilocybe cf. subviscida TaxID=2480587 RepID=A0A8H5AXM6_9AGAR|nr:hypothetical protein D9619_002385 [Psilocybe cf. subviscida]